MFAFEGKSKWIVGGSDSVLVPYAGPCAIDINFRSSNATPSNHWDLSK
jgi:hypothetical protein